MQRTQNEYATEDHLFTEGNPTSGVPATVVDEDWLNMIQEELVNLVEGLGLELDSAAQDQIITGLFGLTHAWSQAQRYAQVALEIDAGAVVWDCNASPSAILYLTEDVTTFSISNYEAGGSYDLAIIQDATGGWALSVPAGLYAVGGSGYEVSSGANARDLLQLLPVYNPNTEAVEPWYMANNGFAEVS
jgi:hypothetical protein